MGDLGLVAGKIANLSNGNSASPAAGLGFVGILPCALQWQAPPSTGKAPKLLNYAAASRTGSQPYAMSSSSSSKNCCGNGSSQPPPASGCCQDCRCCKQSYEHLPEPRLQHQQPPPPLFQHHQQPPPPPPLYSNQQQQQQQQVSCITTLQQTTTTQQMQQLPATPAAGYGYGNCLVPHVPETTTTTTSNTYVSNPLPDAVQHCHTNCRGNETCKLQPCSNSSHPAQPAQPMIFLPFMMPMQQPHMPYPPPCAAPEDFKPLIQVKPAPPPPQPPPPIRNYQQMIGQPPLPPYQTHILPCQKPIRAPMPTPPLPPLPPLPRSVQTLKSVAATAIDAYQRNGKLPRNLPALRAMEMALRTNSFATPNAATAGTPRDEQLKDMADSDSEMEYMPPLHTLSRRKLK
ncbi:WAS/WASL-interacting protein family member 3-like [Drosophila pseudoobscura]|uniref:WAS/WASL-interacting protein family member 3-like n=1 Tax=Drosophila pseudoobscura pseudoobscura TaxID=46245 RepID=A0A6I8VQG2_DROPS|nr:WAS/WASL-interacting protein family member 3 [Drosophila pseudoobscura]